MDEVLTCKCGNQNWVIGTTGIRCGKCGFFLDKEDIEIPDIHFINNKLHPNHIQLPPEPPKDK